VYGLAGRLTVAGGVNGAPWSRGSLGGSAKELNPSVSMIDCHQGRTYLTPLVSWLAARRFALSTLLRLDWVSSVESRSTALLIKKDDRMDEVSVSRSRALADMWGGELSCRRYEGSADLGFGVGGGPELIAEYARGSP
jgi:hypothetical protein